MRITSAKQAREKIGTQVFWDDISAKYHFIRSGILTGVYGRSLEFGPGNWKERRDLKGLRTTEAWSDL